MNEKSAKNESKTCGCGCGKILKNPNLRFLQGHKLKEIFDVNGKQKHDDQTLDEWMIGTSLEKINTEYGPVPMLPAFPRYFTAVTACSSVSRMNRV